MPLFKEDPAHLSKSRLKSDLVAHNVALPPAKSRKEVYVELHLKHVDQKNAADFSSDEEDQGEDVAVEEEDAEVLDPCGLTDDDLKAALLKHGFKAGPIVASTRALYENKLRKLLQPNGHERVNGPEKDVLYSDSEEGEEEDEEEEEEEEEEGSDAATEETVEQPVQVRQQRSQPPLEPVKGFLNDLFPDTQVTPTGIYATRRKPIKGAAGRPFEYVHPDSPASPTTLERRELERRLVPVHIQIFIFLIVVVLLYVIYACVEENSLSPFMALLDGLNPEPDSEGELLLQAKVQDTPAPSGEE